MRPDSEELLQSLRLSLAETIVPALTDRWARYVAMAMDLVLQHLQLRETGELGVITADNADLAHSLGTLGARVAAQATANPSYAAIGAALAPLPAPEPGAVADLASATATNEVLRGQLVALIQALDAAPAPDGGDPQVEAWRDEALRLVRRQVDRVNPLVEPLYMSFSRAGDS